MDLSVLRIIYKLRGVLHCNFPLTEEETRQLDDMTMPALMQQLKGPSGGGTGVRPGGGLLGVGVGGGSLNLLLGGAGPVIAGSVQLQLQQQLLQQQLQQLQQQQQQLQQQDGQLKQLDDAQQHDNDRQDDAVMQDGDANTSGM